MIDPRLVLACKHCGHRPPANSDMETALLHFQVEHDTDEVAFELIAVCACGATMTFVESKATGGGWFDYFECGPCGEQGRIKRTGGGAR